MLTSDTGVVPPPAPAPYPVAPLPVAPIGNAERAGMAQPYTPRFSLDLGSLLSSLNPFNLRAPQLAPPNTSYERVPTLASAATTLPGGEQKPITPDMTPEEARQTRLENLRNAALTSTAMVFQPEGEASKIAQAGERAFSVGKFLRDGKYTIQDAAGNVVDTATTRAAANARAAELSTQAITGAGPVARAVGAEGADQSAIAAKLAAAEKAPLTKLPERAASDTAAAAAGRVPTGGDVSTAASPLARLTSEQLYALRGVTTDAAERTTIDRILADRTFSVPEPARIANAANAVDRRVQSAVRGVLKDHPDAANFDPGHLLRTPEVTAAIDKALTDAKIPVNDQTRTAMAQQVLNNQRGILAKAAAKQSAKAARGAASEAVPAGSEPARPATAGGETPGGTGGAGETTLAQADPKQPGFFSRAVNELINFPRALRATADVSQLLRQGLVPIVSGALSRNAERRAVAAGAFKNALLGYGEKYASETWAKAQADPLFSRWIDSGGFESTIPAKGLAKAKGAKEEFFQSSLAEKIPGVGKVVTGAERSYGLTLNALRFYTWKSLVQAAETGGKALTPVEEKALGKWLNIATGRGSLGDFSAASKVLNAMLFAPRFAIARIEAPIEAGRLLLNPETRQIGIMASKDLAKTAATGLSLLALAQAAGMKVGWDPTSTDFGKIKVGNTSLDIWGGFQQPAVMVARLALDRYTDSKGVQNSLSGAKGTQPTYWDVLTRFAESKLGPTPGMVLALLQGKDYVGNAFGPRGGHGIVATAQDIAGNSIVPLGWGDVLSAVQDLGIPTGLLVGGTSLVGAGVQTREYTPEEKAQNALREKYFSAPAFSIGTPNEWASVYRTLQQYRTLTKGKTATQIRADPNIRAFYNNAIGGRFRNYVTDTGDVRSAVISPQRRALQADPNFKKLGITLDEILARYR